MSNRNPFLGHMVVGNFYWFTGKDLVPRHLIKEWPPGETYASKKERVAKSVTASATVACYAKLNQSLSAKRQISSIPWGNTVGGWGWAAGAFNPIWLGGMVALKNVFDHCA